MIAAENEKLSWRARGASRGHRTGCSVGAPCEVVEYRIEQYAAKLGGRLEALRAVEFGTGCLDRQLDRASDVAITPRA
jgi:hypothetical protein